MQETIKILAEDSNGSSFRWPYYNGIIAWAPSGSFLYHDSMEKIITSLRVDVDDIGLEPEYILAWIWDELLMRLFLHNKDDWEKQIQIVAQDIKDHAEAGEIIKLC